MGLHVSTLLSHLQALVYIICLILPLLCLTELLPPFISQTLRDGTPQVQTALACRLHLAVE